MSEAGLAGTPRGAAGPGATSSPRAAPETEAPTATPRESSSRREFLTGAGTAAIAVGGAVVATRALGGTLRVAHPRKPLPRTSLSEPAWLLAAEGRPIGSDWSALRRQLSSGRLYEPGEVGYEQAKRLFEPRFDGIRPAGVAYCARASDVATCLAFARKYKLAVRIRAGGHSYAGWSTIVGGLVIDVSLMDAFSVAGQTVDVGAGLSLIRFYESLAAHGLAVPAGSCPTVGIAGLALGGGVGVTSRLHGLTSDNLLAVQLVTADGGVLECSSRTHPDLFWACRGGGGGNFGVATAFKFRAHSLTQLCVFSLTWPWQQAANVVGAWQFWAPHAPDRLWSNLTLSAPFGGGPAVSVGGTYAGTSHGLLRHLDEFYHLAGTQPSGIFVRPASYLGAMLLEAGCAGRPLAGCHTGPGGSLPRVPALAKSDFFTRPLDGRGIRALLSAMQRPRGIPGAAGGSGSIMLDALGGAVNRVPADATAFVHRDALFLAQYSTSWSWPGSASGVAAQRDWLRSSYRRLHRHASGQAYQNYVDPELTDWPSAYYGSNYQRLTEVKRFYDPASVFSFPQSIRPTSRQW